MSCICKLKSGIRKGQKCGKTVKTGRFCGIHQKCTQQQPGSLPRSSGVRYLTHWNGGTPFVVDVNKGKKKVIVFSNFNPETGAMKKVCELKYIKLFVPKINGGLDGNTILLKTGKNKYNLIGYSIDEFNTIDGDEIVTFVSPMPGTVPQPYAIGKKYTYLMFDGSQYVDNKIVPKTVLNLQELPTYDLVKLGKNLPVKTLYNSAL